MGPRLLCHSPRTAFAPHAMTIHRHTRDCPVCGERTRRVLFHQDFAAVEKATPVTSYDVVVCERCGCAYADGIPEQTAFDQYYREMSKYEYHQRGGTESE